MVQLLGVSPASVLSTNHRRGMNYPLYSDCSNTCLSVQAGYTPVQARYIAVHAVYIVVHAGYIRFHAGYNVLLPSVYHVLSYREGSW